AVEVLSRKLMLNSRGDIFRHDACKIQRVLMRTLKVFEVGDGLPVIRDCLWRKFQNDSRKLLILENRRDIDGRRRGLQILDKKMDVTGDLFRVSVGQPGAVEKVTAVRGEDAGIDSGRR